MAKGEQKWVSDLIGIDYKRWRDEFIVLDCGTGCGKSYFCLQVLGEHARQEGKQILYLCNRRKLRNQVFDSVKKLNLFNTIYVTSYQTLQRNIQEGREIPYYDYIVADECHYFTTDATFNDYTDISYNYIMKQKHSVVLLVSATAKTFFRNLLEERKVKKKNYYILNKDYSYVDKLYYYQKDELTSIIDDILENEPESKIVVFCNVGERIDNCKISPSLRRKYALRLLAQLQGFIPSCARHNLGFINRKSQKRPNKINISKRRSKFIIEQNLYSRNTKENPKKTSHT